MLFLLQFKPIALVFYAYMILLHFLDHDTPVSVKNATKSRNFLTVKSWPFSLVALKKKTGHLAKKMRITRNEWQKSQTAVNKYSLIR